MCVYIYIYIYIYICLGNASGARALGGDFPNDKLRSVSIISIFEFSI